MHPQKGRSRQRLLSVRTPSRHHFTLPNPGRIRPPCPLAVEQLNRSRRVLLRPLRQVGGNQQVQAATGPLCRRTSRSCSRSASQGADAQARKGPVGSGTTGTGEASPGARNARPVRKAAERAARKAADSAARKIPDSAAGTGPNVSSMSLQVSMPLQPLVSLSSLPSRRLSMPQYLCFSLHVPSPLQVPSSRYMPCPLPTFRPVWPSSHGWKSGRCARASGLVSPSRLSGHMHCYSFPACASDCFLINISPE